MSEQNKERTSFNIAVFITDVAGNAASSSIGGLIGGTDGAVAGIVIGPAVAPAFRMIINEAKYWMLGRREIARVATVLAYAAERIYERQASGDHFHVCLVCIRYADSASQW